jgi:hypothetical protein
MSVSSRTGRATAHVGFPCFGSLTGGPQSGFELQHESETVSGQTVHQPGPLPQFSYFSKLNQVCKLRKPPLWFSKIYQALQSDRLKDKEQLSFWKQVHILKTICIKIPGSKTAFELN